MTYTPQDVKNVLEAVAQEFLVDIPAKHIDSNYYIGLGELEYQFIDGDPEWFAQIAEHINGSTEP
jgi:hypothetical protein